MRGLLSHLDLTASDAARSVAFYDAVLGFLGYRKGEMDLAAIDHAIGGWGIRDADGDGAIVSPFPMAMITPQGDSSNS